MLKWISKFINSLKLLFVMIVQDIGAYLERYPYEEYGRGESLASKHDDNGLQNAVKS